MKSFRPSTNPPRQLRPLSSLANSPSEVATNHRLAVRSKSLTFASASHRFGSAAMGGGAVSLLTRFSETTLGATLGGGSAVRHATRHDVLPRSSRNRPCVVPASSVPSLACFIVSTSRPPSPSLRWFQDLLAT